MSKYDLQAMRRRLRGERPGEHTWYHSSLTRDLTRVTEVVAWGVFDALRDHHDCVTLWTAEHDRLDAIAYFLDDCFLEDRYDEDLAAELCIRVPEYEEPRLLLDHQPHPDSRRGVQLVFRFDADAIRLLAHRLDERGRERERGRYEFDYADPGCFEKLADTLRLDGVHLDLEALA